MQHIVGPVCPLVVYELPLRLSLHGIVDDLARRLDSHRAQRSLRGIIRAPVAPKHTEQLVIPQLQTSWLAEHSSMNNAHASGYWQYRPIDYLTKQRSNTMRTSSILPLLTVCALSACTGSPATLALQPSFVVATATGPDSVSIREAPPGMTFANFEQAVRSGMVSAMPASQPTPPIVPYPPRRIVWHVNSMPPHEGESQLVVNAFDGPTPFAYEAQTVDNDAPPEAIESTVESMTQRLIGELDRHDQVACGKDGTVCATVERG